MGVHTSGPVVSVTRLAMGVTAVPAKSTENQPAKPDTRTGKGVLME